MKFSGRIRSAMDILELMAEQHLPASIALSQWARGNRYAGSTDRAVIGHLVYDVMRQYSSFSALMDSIAPRALVLSCLSLGWDMSTSDIAELCDGSQWAPEALSSEEIAFLDKGLDPNLPDYVQGNYPQWLEESFKNLFGDRAIEEGRAMSLRAPVDLRVNRLKGKKDKVQKALEKFGVTETPFSPVGLRIAPPQKDKKSPNVEADRTHGKGQFEIQDEGSQIVSYMSGAKPGLQVLDLCAGAGGKTLALAALMENKGQVYAYDKDAARLRPIFERVRRANVRNIQVLEAGDEEQLRMQYAGKMDIVLVDAPCSGTGTWRRKPDAKWRLTPEALVQRQEQQRDVLSLAKVMPKAGGRMVYVTCSILPQENDDQIDAFLEQNKDFKVINWQSQWEAHIETEMPTLQTNTKHGLTLTPHQHGTDGFYICVMERAKA